MSRKNGVGQIIEVSTTVLTLVALALWLGVILTPFDDVLAATLRALKPLFPAHLSHCFIALGIINQMAEVDFHGQHLRQLLVSYQDFFLASYLPETPIEPKHLANPSTQRCSSYLFVCFCTTSSTQVFYFQLE